MNPKKQILKKTKKPTKTIKLKKAVNVFEELKCNHRKIFNFVEKEKMPWDHFFLIAIHYIKCRCHDPLTEVVTSKIMKDIIEALKQGKKLGE